LIILFLRAHVAGSIW